MIFAIATITVALAQSGGAFAPLTELAPPNDIRTAAGAPGPGYWQQRADYRMTATADEAQRSLKARAEIIYTNHSPHTLRYLWLLLDQNVHRRDSWAELSNTANARQLARARRYSSWTGGFDIQSVTDARGRPLQHRVVDTLMRVDLSRPLAPHASTQLSLSWSYNIPEWGVVGRRSGYECLSAACIFTAGQWFPRIAAYTDYEGWHTQPLLNGGEFTLEFGDYDVSIDVPANHIVAAAGELRNPRDVLTVEQSERLRRAATADAPVTIVPPEEIQRRGGRKVWRFTARNVRDFAFATSANFIWDAMGVTQADKARPLVMAMSYYPPEASESWPRFATTTIATTLRTYAEHTFAYPYPVAIAVNTGSSSYSGTEYPMLGVISGRPASPAGTEDRHDVLSFLIHEIGHNWFPMIVNSDERKWAWMDEGLNTFLQHQTALRIDGMQQHEALYVSPRKIGVYMQSENQSAIMTAADSLRSSQASYAKPAAALTVLREAVLGREVFDAALREYARDWMFKRPTPADFFRSMEESSGVELTWFWRGWFYSTDAVDLALEGIEEHKAERVYRFTFANRGGVVMPILLDLQFDDGTREFIRIPVDIWRKNQQRVVWQYVSTRSLTRAEVDPLGLTADADPSNNQLGCCTN